MPISSQEFRAALGRFASGVTIITALQDGEKRGMTASAFVSVSMNPPLILISVDKRAVMHAVLEEGEAFAVNILSQSQQLLSNHFAGRPDAGLNIAWNELGGLPVLSGAAAQLACSKYQTYEGGDHTLFVGEVQATYISDKVPLAYFGGTYRGLTDVLPPEVEKMGVLL
ncbi:flavin reductase (plasmid) [Deinococcus psychrotolerans]|uniref:Flavin reductase n=1 Tax=Deinococcus psychrotolerans TaxID=2489213 RepID=A0A3G8YH93_9DEIO|nr:flavin reductase family protein [Deinococcus psychrotolerans]AZI44689.1 flavin reductase [Deinococcus psychrotolerans]